ncbi:ABC transporter substrate-binding protein [Cellulomonas edaphi]|uniref:ABC transporter substrate-binding protein n=1 Tax=Cellulomonas edaphi TaxID=3053468 RepID=A0ABT7S434_9CELL|nr:ABC transporter substrate-binding protein [Cellulomons edaphi]MDM7830361.1 ABC transporter substrate-binding protein [Cellulomons edaphi]
MRSRRALLVVPALVSLALATAACSGSPSDGPTAAASAPPTVSGTIQFWHFFTDREADVIQGVVDDFEAANPGVKVVVKSGQDDQKMRQAISAGQPIDVGLSYSTDQVGPLCSSGDFTDLASFIERDKVDLTQIPDTVLGYTEYKGKRCTMPALADVYGLYYNKKLLADAGYTAPPKTLAELTDMAVKLTTFKADGSIKTLGFMPLLGYYENAEAHWAPSADAQWLNEDGTSAISGSPGWTTLLEWQKDLIAKLGGYDKLAKFQAGLGEEFSAQNDFQTGRVAMNLDGEYRTAFIDDQAEDLDYGTAPFPSAQGFESTYGGGYITGNIVGIGKGSTNPEAAWAFVKYLTTNTDAQVKLSNGLKNVPTMHDAIASPDLEVSPQFQTFLDIFENEHSATTPPSGIGAEYQTIFGTHTAKWQSGKETDLPAMLKTVDQEIDAAVQLQAGS